MLTSPRVPKERGTIPKACPVALLHGICDSGLSLEQRWKKESFDGVQLQTPRKGEAWYCGTLFNTSIDSVKPEKRLIVSLYLNEFLD